MLQLNEKTVTQTYFQIIYHRLQIIYRIILLSIVILLQPNIFIELN